MALCSASFLSYAAARVTDHARDTADRSAKVQAAYDAVTHGQQGVFNTRLALDSIEIKERPLPTRTSPDWFTGDFKTMLRRYYDVDLKLIFE